MDNINNNEPVCYVILTTVRSGSSLLCDLLKNSGIFQCPHSHYEILYSEALKEQCPKQCKGNIHEYFSTALKLSSMQYKNKIIQGLKILSVQLQELSRSFDNSLKDFTHILPINTKFILLNRHNIHDQAISFYKAMYTGVWSGETEDQVFFNGAAIDNVFWLLKRRKKYLNNFIVQNSLYPKEIEYETFVHDFEGTIKSIFDYLELPAPQNKIIKTRFVRQYDSLSKSLSHQYSIYTKKTVIERKFKWLFYILLQVLYKLSAILRKNSRIYSKFIDFLKRKIR